MQRAEVSNRSITTLTCPAPKPCVDQPKRDIPLAQMLSVARRRRIRHLVQLIDKRLKVRLLETDLERDGMVVADRRVDFLPVTRDLSVRGLLDEITPPAYAGSGRDRRSGQETGEKETVHCWHTRWRGLAGSGEGDQRRRVTLIPPETVEEVTLCSK